MSIENILNNKECKLIFLKAIVLGINYGKSENANYYLESIEKEILKINVINEEPIIIEKKNDIIQKYDNIILNLNNQKKYTLIPLSSFYVFKNHMEIKVKDNGMGIPQKVLDKIFQPFFTTKPTGHGTGLGLSLSYDIVKAHGGELKVETKTDEGATFTIVLPLN